MDEQNKHSKGRKRRMPSRETVVITVVAILLAAIFIIGFMFLRGEQEVDRVLTLLLNFV